MCTGNLEVHIAKRSLPDPEYLSTPDNLHLYLRHQSGRYPGNRFFDRNTGSHQRHGGCTDAAL